MVLGLFSSTYNFAFKLCTLVIRVRGWWCCVTDLLMWI